MQSKTPTRRRHSDDLKTQVLHECSKPGASVAAIALSHGLNANLVHRWRRLAACEPEAQRAPVAPFIALPLMPPAPPAPPPPADIRIELRRGAATVSVSWPVSAAGDCAAWLREWLR